MNLINSQKMCFVVCAIFSIAAFQLILAKDKSDGDEDSEDDDSSMEIDEIGTFRSSPEYIIEELGSKLEGGSNSLIGRTLSDILNELGNKFQLIFPGTQWCGDGNGASNESDLGHFEKTDNCCRNHDNCPDDLTAGESQGRLKNNGIFTRSSCTCDHEFYKCLKNAKTVVATAIGTTYFNILRPQCFANDYPIESCAKHDSVRLFRKKCLEYNFDTSKDKMLQWFDNSDF